MGNLASFINEEQLLFICSEVCVNTHEESEEYKIASTIITVKAIQNLLEKNDDKQHFDAEDISVETGKILAAHVLDKMSHRGLVEQSLDNPEEYELVDLGQLL